MYCILTVCLALFQYSGYNCKQNRKNNSSSWIIILEDKGRQKKNKITIDYLHQWQNKYLKGMKEGYYKVGICVDMFDRMTIEGLRMWVFEWNCEAKALEKWLVYSKGSKEEAEMVEIERKGWKKIRAEINVAIWIQVMRVISTLDFTMRQTKPLGVFEEK